MYEATTTQSLSGGELFLAFVFLTTGLVILAVALVSLWRIFTKAGQAGWKSLVPIYNTYIIFKIVGLPGWYLLLLVIPLVNIVIALYSAYRLGKVFGMTDGIDILVFVILPLFGLPVGYLMVAFGNYEYTAPGAAAAVAGPTEQPTAPAQPAEISEATPQTQG